MRVVAGRTRWRRTPGAGRRLMALEDTMSRFYRSFEEFAREELKPSNRIGWSMDDLESEADNQREEVLFDEIDLDDT